MDRKMVIALMESSKNKQEWNDNCDKVQAALDGCYPDFWYAAIVQSGLMDRVLGAGSSDAHAIDFSVRLI